MTLFTSARILVFTLASTLAAWPGLRAAEVRSLFNGRNLEGWDTYLGKPHPSVKLVNEKRNAKGEHTDPVGLNQDPKNVFTIVQVDGRPAIRISGEIFGAIVSKESFSDYLLRVEMKWGEKRWAPRLTAVRDSGLLYHSNGPWGTGANWLPSLELQIQQGDFGDFWGVYTRAVIRARQRTEKEWVYDASAPEKWFSQPGDIRRCFKSEDHELPYGQWNVVEVVCLGDKSWHVVNGHVVMRLEQNGRYENGAFVPATAGRLQIQSEGSELFVREISLQPITAVPAKYR